MVFQTSFYVPNQAVAIVERIGWGIKIRVLVLAFISCSKRFLRDGYLFPFKPGIPQLYNFRGYSLAPPFFISRLSLGPVRLLWMLVASTSQSIRGHHSIKDCYLPSPASSSPTLSRSSHHCHTNENNVRLSFSYWNIFSGFHWIPEKV